MKDNWINISSKIPKIDTWILVYHLRFNEVVQVYYTHGDELEWFKHWQPLPEPPRS